MPITKGSTDEMQKCEIIRKIADLLFLLQQEQHQLAMSVGKNLSHVLKPSTILYTYFQVCYSTV